MTHAYCTESIGQRLSAFGLPFAPIFARALVALLTARKISLHHVAQLMPGEQNPEANRQQIRRSLDHETLAADSLTKVLASLSPQTPWVLALDRTEWKRGRATVNLLVLAVVVHGCAVPLLRTVMPACGAGDTSERQELMRRFLALFGKQRIKYLTADREFIGREWIGWLLTEKIPLRIRIKTCEYLFTRTGANSGRINGLPCGRAAVSPARCACGACLFLSAVGGCGMVNT